MFAISNFLVFIFIFVVSPFSLLKIIPSFFFPLFSDDLVFPADLTHIVHVVGCCIVGEEYVFEVGFDVFPETNQPDHLEGIEVFEIVEAEVQAGHVVAFVFLLVGLDDVAQRVAQVRLALLVPIEIAHTPTAQVVGAAHAASEHALRLLG